MNKISSQESQLLSAVIPLRSMRGKLQNLSKTLHACKDLPIQVILVHDDSGDGTHEELQELVKSISQVNLEIVRVNLESPGLARNAGKERLKTDWICFWDSDDLPDPSAYLRLLNRLLRSNSRVGIGQITSVANWDSTSKKIHNILNTGANLYLELANMPAFTRMIFHRSVVDDISFNELRSGEDQCFLRDTNFLNFLITISSESIYTYFTSSEGQLTRNREALRDHGISLSYLCSQFTKSTGTMRDFSLAQIVKLFLGSISLGVRQRIWMPLFRNLNCVLLVIFQNPIKSARIIHYFLTHRIDLSGR